MLDADRLLDDARTASGLDDYGDMTFAEGLRVLVTSVNDEAGLTADHEATLRNEMVKVLINRLRMQADLTAHPEILDEELLPPVFITSMPRTGSTKLHRMLAAAGDLQGIPFWMSYNFAPIPGDEDNAQRLQEAVDHLEWVWETAPLYQKAHPQYPDEFEEELSLLDAGFNSLYRWAAFLHIPTYIEWVLARDGMAAFQDLRVMLQYLQWQHYRGQGKRWVLKTPSLFGWEGAYAATFPGTDFIVTHRHPRKTWPSVCVLFCGVRGLYSDADFSAMAGEVMGHNFATTQVPHLAWREAYPREKVLDVAFEEVIDDEVAVVRRVYEWLGLPFTADTEARLAAWLEMDGRRGHERNLATLEEYGLTEAGIDERFAPYIERYKAFL